MNKNRDMTYTYKGFICVDTKDDYTIKLGIIYKSEMFFITISDHENIYDQLKPNQLITCIVEFQDGTEPIDFIDAKDKEFEDIFIWIQDLLSVSLENDGDNVLQILSPEENYEERKEFQEMYQSLLDDEFVKKTINIYKKYTKKWVEMH